MKVTRSFYFWMQFIAFFFMTGTGFSQIFKPQVDISLGGGLNLSYFDVGGGTPGLSLTSSTMYHWTDHWKAGLFFGVHHVKGTDEGTPMLGRGLAYDSNLYEFSGRVEYILYFSSSWKSKWKQKVNPMLPYGGTWKRKVKPFLFAGAGVVQYRPYVYYYPTSGGLDENPALASVAAIINGGFGVYYYVNRYFSISLDGKINLPLFNYFEDFKTEDIENTMDLFYVIGIRFIWSMSAG